MAGHAVRTADLHVEDDNGNNWALVTVNDFVPAQVSPVALVLAGPADGGVPSTVLRTELLETVDGRTVVLVTFRPRLSSGDRVPGEEAREWARRLWAWIVEHGGMGEVIPFERDVPAWLREPDDGPDHTELLELALWPIP